MAETTPSTLNKHLPQYPTGLQKSSLQPSTTTCLSIQLAETTPEPLTTTCLNIQLAGRNHAFNPQQPLASTYNWQKPHLQPSTTTCLNIQLADITPSTLNNLCLNIQPSTTTPSTLNNHVPQHPTLNNHASNPQQLRASTSNRPQPRL